MGLVDAAISCLDTIAYLVFEDTFRFYVRRGEEKGSRRVHAGEKICPPITDTARPITDNRGKTPRRHLP
jgi:hypothetical protein